MECDLPPSWGTLTTGSDGRKPGDVSESKRGLCEAKTKGRPRSPVGSRTERECPGSLKKKTFGSAESEGLRCSPLLLLRLHVSLTDAATTSWRS